MARTLEWHVGHVVSALRDERKWTQAKLAKAAGIGRQAVGKVERNDPGQRAGNLKKVAAALGLTEPELYAMVPRRTFIEPKEPPRAEQDQPATGVFRRTGTGPKKK